MSISLHTAPERVGVPPVEPGPVRTMREPKDRQVGVVVTVCGSVADMRFDGGLPTIHSVSCAGDGSRVAIEVLAQRDARHVRGIALTPTQGLASGTQVCTEAAGAADTL